MKYTLWLVSVLGCFFATCVEGGLPRRLRIEGGALALAGEFKYAVGLLIGTGIADMSTCTGSIIDERFILTAAHCLTNRGKRNNDGTFAQEFAKSMVIVYVNTTNFVENVQESSKRIPAKAYFVSEFFNNGLADIAIIELGSPLNLKDGNLQKLELPSSENNSYEGVQAVFAGFGSDSKGANDFNLKKAHYRVVPFSKCHYKGVELYRQTSMCVISVTEDNKRPNRPLGACHGDSGGPLVHGNTVIGILTDGTKSCDARSRYPQIFANVSHYKDFINHVIGKLGTSSSITEFKLGLYV